MIEEEQWFVFLAGNQPEKLLDREELRAHLTPILPDHLPQLPPSIRTLPTIAAQVEALIDNYCDLALDTGESWQWYATRLEK